MLMLTCSAAAWSADVKFKLENSAVADRTMPRIVYVDYTGNLPADLSPYTTATSWRVFWSEKPDSPLHAVEVLMVAPPDNGVQKIQLQLKSDGPPAGSTWTVLFNPAGPPYVLPQIIAGKPFKPEANTEAQQADNGKPTTSNSKKLAFSPVAAGKTPDITFNASYLAAGGTKPIYGLLLKGSVDLPGEILKFNPGISTDIEINQNLKPPVNSTTFDPDSITAGLAFTRSILVQSSPLYDVNLQLALPNGEFSKSDPSSNIIFNPAASFVLNAWQPKPGSSFYATLFPFMALEAGENLSKPASIEKVPVNLSHYNAITRGVLGADAALAIATPDRSSSIFSVTGTYRVRLPAFDEPEVRTLHHVTTIDQTTKARHWVEGDINYAPWSFKYLSITAKYQYGELPPLFKLVDHSFTLGLTLKASQINNTKSFPALK